MRALFSVSDEMQNCLESLLGGWVRVRMEDQKRERQNGGSASKVLIAEAVVGSVRVAVTEIYRSPVALILLLVDPIDDMLVFKY